MILFVLYQENPLGLTRAGEYAVRCVLYLASQGQGELCKRKTIAEAMDIPDQILGQTVSHQFCTGRRHRHHT
jgi:hypothetical protein